MHIARYMITLLLITRCGCVLAQQWINPHVQVHWEAISEQEAERLSGLSGQVSDYLQSFWPSTSSVHLIPIVPVTYSVDLAIIESSGTEQVVDLKIAAFRPIFEQDTESLILLASETRIPFSYTPSKVFVSNDLNNISDALYLRLHYYTTLALALYYDSMDTYGGDAFWKSLQTFQAQYEVAWQNLTPGSSLPPLHPRILLPEISSQWGDHFRDFWCMYHLETLDYSDDPKQDANFIYILDQLAQLYSANHLYTLFQLLRDAKSSEVRGIYDTMSTQDKSRARPYIQLLFSTDTP